MDSLFRKIGVPPYNLDQIFLLLDEASSLSSNPEKPPAQIYDAAVETVESVEALAWLCKSAGSGVFSQFRSSSGSTVDELAVLSSIGPKTSHLKDWLFDGFQLCQISRSAHGTAKLCQYCNWSFRRIARGPNNYHADYSVVDYSVVNPQYLLANDHCPEFPVLEERSLQGCDFCRFLREHLLSLVVSQPGEFTCNEGSVSVWIEFSWSWDTSRRLERVEVKVLGESHPFFKDLYFTIDTTNDNVAEELGIFRPPATRSLDPANVEFIKCQLALSEESVATSGYRPKRLMDIGISTQSEPKLINGEQAEVGVRGLRYAALSYCWGPADESKNQLKLTTETQRILYSSVPLGLITPVLRDAIAVCRALDLRYLWIDCLCIQQDGGNTDWEEQSQEMSHIFGNSWLTICAPAANSCLEGFLDHIDRHSGAIEIEYVAAESQQAEGSFFLRLLTLNGKLGYHDDDRVAILDPLQRDLEYSEWSRRGWVFQERILSPRLLYFGARMIHFQHGDHITSESGFSIHRDLLSPSSDTPARAYCSTNLLHQLQMIQDQGPFIIDFWYQLVTMINPSNFTDRQDTLPAIAGIARQVQESTKHRYLAGLWEEDLCCGLLWDVASSSLQHISRYTPSSLRQLLKSIKEADSIAPSWSWASRRSILDFRLTNKNTLTCRVRRHLRADFEVLQSHVLVDGVNAYGRVSSASISLIGSMIRLAPNLVASMQWAGMGDSLFEVSPGHFTFIRGDWEPFKPNAAGIRMYKSTGIKKQMRARFHLLLIASCCSDWSRSHSTRTAQSEPHNERAGSEAGPTESPQASVWSTGNMTDEMWEEVYKLDYKKSFYEDSHPGFDATVHCDLCSDQTLIRDIWGLLIYPAGPADTFYRVGTFFSRAAFGGSAIFEGAERRMIVLV